MMLATLISCEKTEEPQQTSLPGKYDNGVFICNEGPFMSGTGTISFLNYTDGVVYNNLYENVNQLPLGNIVQSMETYGDFGYIVVNNANKIEIVDLKNLQRSGSISGLTLPRYILPVSQQKAYVSCWDNTLAVIDLTSKSIKKNIPVGTGPEKMLLLGEQLFVLNQGGFGIDSVLSVIQTSSDSVTATVQVYPKPTGIVSDKEGKIWVLCSGNGYNGFPAAGDSEGHLVCINPQSKQIIRDIPFPGTSIHPEKLVINQAGDRMYFLYKDGVYDLGITSTALSQKAFIPHSGYLYALGLDQKNDLLYVSDPVDYVQDGWVYRYLADKGFVVDSFKTGIIPTHFSFR